MLSIFDSFRSIDLFSMLMRMVFAFLCGGIIGLERSYKNRPAGFRTHILVCIAATIASSTGIYLYLNAHIPTDVSRIGAQVVSGLGFIGGGTIIVTRKKTIKGLTTAAGLWAAGIIGLAVGAGFYEGAMITTVCVLLTEIYASKVTQRMKRASVYQIQLLYEEKSALDQVLRYSKDHRFAINNLQVTGTSDIDASYYTAYISMRARQIVELEPLLDYFETIPGVISVEGSPV